MLKVFSIVAVVFCAVHYSCKSSKKVPDNLADVIVGTWYHSFEEDSADVKCFRKEGYRFPEARGRMGMVFKAKGAFEQINIGQTDKEERVQGSWKVHHNNMLDIQLFQQKKFVYKVKVLEANKNKIRWQVVPQH